MKKDYQEFKKEVQEVADKCGLSDQDIRDTYTELEIDRIRNAGINGAKAGESLRNILLKLKGK